jgi:uncharacterized protein YjhX (UPF0386 family)
MQAENRQQRVLHLLRKGKLWFRIADDYEPLKVEGMKREGHAYSAEGQRKLLAVGRSNPDWKWAYYALIFCPTSG